MIDCPRSRVCQSRRLAIQLMRAGMSKRYTVRRAIETWEKLEKRRGGEKSGAPPREGTPITEAYADSDTPIQPGGLLLQL